MPATDYLIMNAAKYPDEVALVEVNPAIRDERGKTWRDYELVETPPSQRYRRELTWRTFNAQANRFAHLLIDAGVERLGLDPSRVAITIDHTANSSSACIPITLDTLNRQGKLLPGQLVAVFGFGSGLVTGSCLLRWGA